MNSKQWRNAQILFSVLGVLAVVLGFQNCRNIQYDISDNDVTLENPSPNPRIDLPLSVSAKAMTLVDEIDDAEIRIEIESDFSAVVHYSDFSSNQRLDLHLKAGTEAKLMSLVKSMTVTSVEPQETSCSNSFLGVSEYLEVSILPKSILKLDSSVVETVNSKKLNVLKVGQRGSSCDSFFDLASKDKKALSEILDLIWDEVSSSTVTGS